jgi:adenine-specific DNA-methyltransferase
MVQRRKLLATLTRARLADLAKTAGITGVAGKSKDSLVQAIAGNRGVKTTALLDVLSRDELKDLCQTFGLDGGGRDKRSLIARLTGNGEFAPTSRSRLKARRQSVDPRKQASGKNQVGSKPNRPRASSSTARKRGTPHMAKKQNNGKRPIEQYEHEDKTRLNNPPVGLVTPTTDPDQGKKTYQYDPHLDPQLQWAGKAEHTSFEVPTVSLHVHERVDPRSIIRAVQKRNGNGGKPGAGKLVQQSFFEAPEENLPLREAIDFYKHAHGWSNRLIAGDSLMVMNSLLEKEGMAGKVQMVYIDPPYGIKYRSNFQPFVNQRDVAEADKDEDLTQEPEMIQAFRDTWQLGVHSYLTCWRDRIALCRDLLSETGSIFVQISTQNVNLMSAVLDEIFGPQNRVEQISFRKKTMPLGGRLLEGNCDYILWYAKDKEMVKYHSLFKPSMYEGDPHWNYVELPSGERRQLTSEEIESHRLLPEGADVYQLIGMYPAGAFDTGIYDFEYEDTIFRLPKGKSWKTPIEGMKRLAVARRLQPYSSGTTLRYILKASDYPITPLDNVWADTSAPSDKVYVVQTSRLVVQRCLLMTTDPGDLVYDPTCGSGTTSVVAEQWGRRWITSDTSRVATTLAKQRIMTAFFPYYQLAIPEDGISSGFVYKTLPHVTLKSIANNPEIREGMTPVEIEAAIARYAEQETLYDKPVADKAKVRVTGPFTVEAVPAQAVRPISEIVVESQPVDLDTQPALPGIGALEAQSKLQFTQDVSVARYGETLRQRQWRDELLACGIRAKGGQRIEFARLEPLGGTRWLQCEGETKGPSPQRAVVSFGSEHAPLEQRQVAMALDEAQQLRPAPTMIIFATFQFDPEAAKDIDETKWPGVTLLKVQMNTDLLTDDLKKNRSGNESYWLMGQPDVELRQIKKGDHKGEYEIEVHGFDYYNTRTGSIESGDTAKIAMWMLDTDYDGRSLFPRQVFFPMAGLKDGWARLARNLKAEIDEDLIEAYRGTVSLPFEPGEYKRVAVKIVDDRGIESLKVISIE